MYYIIQKSKYSDYKVYYDETTVCHTAYLRCNVRYFDRCSSLYSSTSYRKAISFIASSVNSACWSQFCVLRYSELGSPLMGFFEVNEFAEVRYHEMNLFDDYVKDC